jgi:Ca2+:H+ antiporter
MSAKADAIQHSKNKRQPESAIRGEFPLLIGWGTAAIFIAIGTSALNDFTTHIVPLLGVFAWLFAVVFWSAIRVVRHADCLAIKLGEPYGTLILTLSAIGIEVVIISTAMLHGDNNPTLGRDAIFAVIMIALNGLVGLSLLLGGLRYREQHYNIQGVNAYLNVIMALAVLGLVLPNFTTSTSGPTFSTEQEIFFVTMSLSLYATFLLIETLRHRGYFVEAKETAAKPSII